MTDAGAPRPPGRGADLVEELVAVGEDVLRLLRPADPAALLDEDAFAEDEFLPYWAELWPSARNLAAALPRRLARRRVLELGCGLGLPSLVAARRGATVTATDWAEDALALLALNAARNDLALATARLDWTRVDAGRIAEPVDLVLAADVCYEHRNVAPLAALLGGLACEVLLADPGRAAGVELLTALSATHASTPVAPGVSRLVPRRPRPVGP